MDEAVFDIDRLATFLLVTVHGMDYEDELFLKVTTDPQLADSADLNGSERTKDPFAYLFKIQDNIFLRMRDSEGFVRSLTIKGINVLEPKIGEAQIHFACQSFSSYGGEEISARDLRLVVKNLGTLSISEINRIIIYYDKLFSFPNQLTQTLIHSCGEAQRSPYCRPFPILYDVQSGMENEQSNMSNKSVFFQRQSDGQRFIRVYEDGEVVFSRDFSSMDDFSKMIK
jgi:hypothetical protein